MKRFVCVHGHFYQPPRENPWTGDVERQPSAGRDHDWNARVARECYIPNGEARVVDGERRLTDVVDNYAWISFNFGPTLLSWLEKERPAAYARLLEADAESVKRLGHGNALAQAFHH
ncbi:MAG: glycoside hydrolase, partial [Elusimicrobia bacterium]|nr:glycoside hydrolase [Elusimicrobiota bacterium]